MPNPEEFRRTRRIVDLLLRIANQPRRWTRRDLAAHYEISEQQVDKDLRLIRHGLVMSLLHCREGYYFERLARLPALTLSLPEALSLLLAARLGQQMPGVSRSDLAAAVARLAALL
ncbi:MAG: WYL domain-containing protein, partial [Actinobacteria bacterium]|nr:WYL domain-containing protein [Actinomycetota bacterium]